ncbi:MAG: hypothetical protein ACOWWM_13095 [Desulfobacterales bacterium]
MPKPTLIEMGDMIRRIYRERSGGDPQDLVRVWDEGDLLFVLKNDDTQSVMPIGDVIHGREDAIAKALENFQPM